MNNKTKQGGLGIVSVLTIIFIVLKLLGVIKWSWIWVLSPRMNFLFVPIRESFCKGSLSVCPPAFLPISLVDIAQRTSVCTHNCISYSNTPNTGCPVLGVHITLRLRRFFFAALDEVLPEGFFHFLRGQFVQNILFGRSFSCQVGSLPSR